MTDDYFARLDSELAACTRRGTHPGARPPRLARGTRRAAASIMLVLALAASLVTEFPASARGSTEVTAAAVTTHLQRGE